MHSFAASQEILLEAGKGHVLPTVELDKETHSSFQVPMQILVLPILS